MTPRLPGLLAAAVAAAAPRRDDANAYFLKAIILPDGDVRGIQPHANDHVGGGALDEVDRSLRAAGIRHRERESHVRIA